MNEREIRALISAIDKLMGDPLEADAREIEVLFSEFDKGKNPAQSVFEIASRSAQTYRLQGVSVPAHVEEALRATKNLLSGETIEAVDPARVIDAVVNPLLGPVHEVCLAFRNRTERTERDKELLENLSREVKEDWSKGGKE